MKAKILNTALFISFILTILVPITGIHIHKLASTLFLLLCFLHTILYRRRLGMKKYLLLGLSILCFVSGLLGMILDQHPIVLILHRVLSIAAVFFFAIHIFVYHKKLPGLGKHR